MFVAPVARQALPSWISAHISCGERGCATTCPSSSTPLPPAPSRRPTRCPIAGRSRSLRSSLYSCT